MGRRNRQEASENYLMNGGSTQPPGTLTGEQVEALTGLTDRRVRQLAKAGYFSPPVRGLYKQTETIRGLFKYYREDRHAEAKTMHDEKLLKIKAERELKELELARAKRESVSSAIVDEAFKTLGAKWDLLLTQKLETEIPARLLGKDIVASRSEARLVHDEIRGICNSGLSRAHESLTPDDGAGTN